MIHASVGNIPFPSLSLVSCLGKASREVVGTCKDFSTTQRKFLGLGHMHIAFSHSDCP